MRRLLAPLLLALLFCGSAGILLAQEWQDGDEYMLLKTGPSVPYDVIVYGDSVSYSGNENNGWFVEWGGPALNIYFTPVVTTSVVTLTAEFYSGSPGNWVVGGAQGSCGFFSNVYGTGGAWTERSWSTACNLYPGNQYALQFIPGGGNAYWIRNIRFTSNVIQREVPETSLDPTCDTVSNFSFETAAAWSGFGSVITNGVVILGENDYVAQNISLDPNLTYSAVFSIARVISGLGNTQMTVSMGSQVQTVTLSYTGLYTTTFTTPDNLAGPIQYKISNRTGGEFDVEYTCLYPGDSEEIRNCIAPTNGEFTTSSHWDWHRNAVWNAPSQSAVLPFNSGDDSDRSLIVSTSAYSLPALSEGQYLLLDFQAGTQQGQMAVLSSLVGQVEHFFEVYGPLYDFEADISSTAGQSVTVAFSNSGPEEGDFLAEDTISLDNVCIFISDQPPNLPTPRDFNDITAFDFGFNYGCVDVPALLLGYGIDMSVPVANYAAGVSVWEPQNYIPWLAGALWVNVGSPISCFLVEFMRLVVGMTEQVINTITNIVNWQLRTGNSAMIWGQQGGFYSTNSFYGWYRGWFNWFANAQRMMSQNWRILGRWLFGLPDELADSLFPGFNVLLGLWNDNLQPYLQFDLSGRQLPTTETAHPLPFIGDGPFDWFSNFLGATDMIVVLANLGWFALDWVINNVLSLVLLPFTVYQSYRDGVAATAFESLVVCENQNFWCSLLAGMQMVNTATAHTIGYPVIIVGITIATIYLVIWNLQKIVEIKFD